MNLMLRAAPQVLRRTARGLALALLLTVSSCTAEPPPPPPQPAALPGTIERGSDNPLTGAGLARAQNTRDHLRSRLEQHYEASWDATWYELPASTMWDAMTAHFAAELGPNWEVDTRYPEGGARDPGYSCMVWSDGDRAVAIAYTVADPGNGRVLTVLLPTGDQ
ncbi:hypothetical protein AB0F72_02090 [Actinoplanes sp. NPDC023936]|uniref:hypothetical protein n=1 Tax=Actinoplanes sp. NPDC023936 TaxID=3154910 RepID=UPI00340A6782